MLDLTQLQYFFGWCALFNFGVLLWWFGFILFAKDWVYNVHTIFLKISMADFEKIHYQAIALYKIIIFSFFVIPYFVMMIINQ